MERSSMIKAMSIAPGTNFLTGAPTSRSRFREQQRSAGRAPTAVSGNPTAQQPPSVAFSAAPTPLAGDDGASSGPLSPRTVSPADVGISDNNRNVAAASTLLTQQNPLLAGSGTVIEHNTLGASDNLPSTKANPIISFADTPTSGANVSSDGSSPLGTASGSERGSGGRLPKRLSSDSLLNASLNSNTATVKISAIPLGAPLRPRPSHLIAEAAMVSRHHRTPNSVGGLGESSGTFFEHAGTDHQKLTSPLTQPASRPHTFLCRPPRSPNGWRDTTGGGAVVLVEEGGSGKGGDLNWVGAKVRRSSSFSSTEGSRRGGRGGSALCAPLQRAAKLVCAWLLSLFSRIVTALVVTTVVALAGVAVASIYVSEKEYTGAVSDFVEDSAASFAARVALGAQSRFNLARFMVDGAQQSFYFEGRLLPTDEELLLGEASAAGAFKADPPSAATGNVYDLTVPGTSGRVGVSSWVRTVGNAFNNFRESHVSKVTIQFTDGASAEWRQALATEQQGFRAAVTIGIPRRFEGNGTAYRYGASYSYDLTAAHVTPSPANAPPPTSVAPDRRTEQWFTQLMGDTPGPDIPNLARYLPMHFGGGVAPNASSVSVGEYDIDAYVSLVGVLGNRTHGALGRVSADVSTSDIVRQALDAEVFRGSQVMVMEASGEPISPDGPPATPERVLASTTLPENLVTQSHLYYTRPIADSADPSSVVLTTAETEIGCRVLARPPRAGAPPSYAVVCPHTVPTVGFAPLTEARQKHPELFDYSSATLGRWHLRSYVGSTYVTTPRVRDVTAVRAFTCAADGRRYIVATTPIIIPRTYGVRLLSVVIVPEVDMHMSLDRVRTSVAAIAAAVTVAFAIALCVFFACVLGPLASVAETMALGPFASESQRLDPLFRRRTVRLLNKAYEANKKKAAAAAAAKSTLGDAKASSASSSSPPPSVSFFSEVRHVQLSHWSYAHLVSILSRNVSRHVLDAEGQFWLSDLNRLEEGDEDGDGERGTVVKSASSTTMPHASSSASALTAAGLSTWGYDSTATCIDIPSGTVGGSKFGELFGSDNSSNSSNAFGAGDDAIEIDESANIPLGGSATALVLSSFRVPSSAAATAPAPPPYGSRPPEVFFKDISLIDRHISVVHINVAGFHLFVLNTHPEEVRAAWGAFLTFVHNEARRFGGILESFHGDRLWVSFNATSKCDHHEVAAAYFAHHVTTVVNESAIAGLEGRRTHKSGGRPLPAPDPSISPTDPRFAACRWGITCGAATGKALVGSVEGEDTGRRTTLISNAVSEAAALERLGKSYPAAGAIVAGDMIGAIEGYCQYQVVDAMLLPGSGGKRVRIACLKGPMLGSGKAVGVVSRWLAPCAASSSSATATYAYEPHALSLRALGETSSSASSTPSGRAVTLLARGASFTNLASAGGGGSGEAEVAAGSSLNFAVPTTNPYADVNEAFIAFLEGSRERYEKSVARALAPFDVPYHPATAAVPEWAFVEQCRAVYRMVHFTEALAEHTSGNKKGKAWSPSMYTSPHGEQFHPRLPLLSLCTFRDYNFKDRRNDGEEEDTTDYMYDDMSSYESAQSHE